MIVGRTFLIPCGEAPVLLQPVDHPLHPFSGTVDSSVKWPFPALVALPRDGDPDAVLPAILPELSTAVALVAHDAMGTALGPPSPRSLDGPLGHEVGKDWGLMPVARRQDERHELAVAFRPHVDLRTEAALTPAKRCGVCASLCGARRMLMRPDDGPIHVVGVPIELACAIRLLLDGSQEAGPETRLPPAIKTACDGAPWAIPLRQITPGGPGAEEPEDTVEDASVVSGWAACFWLLRGKQGL